MNSNPLQRLIYTSQAGQHYDEGTLVEYCNGFARANAEVNLTGVLIHIGGRFMQVLEGKPATIRTLMSRIKRDSRHHDIRILVQDIIVRRMFSHWSMALLDFQSPEAHTHFDSSAVAALAQMIENVDSHIDSRSDVVRLMKTVPRLMKVYRLPRAGRVKISEPGASARAMIRLG